MMMGVAQVMGMKPTLRSFFSGAPPWAKASRAVASGNTEAIAAIAVAAPTFFRNSRRWASTGKTARRTAASTTRLKRCSSLAGTADRRAWSAGAWSPPQPQRCLSRVLGSNGSLNMLEASSLLAPVARIGGFERKPYAKGFRPSENGRLGGVDARYA